MSYEKLKVFMANTQLWERLSDRHCKLSTFRLEKKPFLTFKPNQLLQHQQQSSVGADRVLLSTPGTIRILQHQILISLMVPNWFIQVSLLAVTGGRSSHRHRQRQRLVHGTVSFQTSTRWKTQSADVRFHPETPLSWWQEWKERRYSQQSRRRKSNTTGSPAGPELWGHSSDPGAGLGIRLHADGFDAPHLEYLCLRRWWVQEKMLSSWSTRKVATVSLLSDVHGADSVSHHCQSGPGVVFSSSTCLCSQQDEG